MNFVAAHILHVLSEIRPLNDVSDLVPNDVSDSAPTNTPFLRLPVESQGSTVDAPASADLRVGEFIVFVLGKLSSYFLSIRFDFTSLVTNMVTYGTPVQTPTLTSTETL
jgi:hypothetical protein